MVQRSSRTRVRAVTLSPASRAPRLIHGYRRGGCLIKKSKHNIYYLNKRSSQFIKKLFRYFFLQNQGYLSMSP
jgi:hypothetical protein